MYEITRDYIRMGNSRSGQKISRVLFIVSHDTGNPGSTAYQNQKYFNNSQPSASAHTFIDDKVILEIIPTTEKAWHVQYNKPTDNRMFGDDANDAAIGVELCWGGNINFQEAYKRYVWYHAYLCKTYNLQPRKHIVSHKTLDPQRRSDPDNALNRYGITWNQFIDDVAKAYDEKPKQQVGELYLLYVDGLLIGRYTTFNALKFARDHLDKGAKEITMLRNDVAKAYSEKLKEQSSEQPKPQVDELYLLYVDGILIGRYTAYNALKFAGDHLDKGAKEITMLRNDVAQANGEKPKEQPQPNPQVGELYLLYVDGLLIGRYTAYNALKFAEDHLDKGAKEIRMVRV